MTGPVGGAVALTPRGPSAPPPSRPSSYPAATRRSKRERTASKKYQQHHEPNLLTSIAGALQTNTPANPLLDAAASSEETTVCQLDTNAVLKKAAQQSSTVLNNRQMETSRNERALGERNGYDDYRDRDPNIPGSITCINTTNCDHGGDRNHHPGSSRHYSNREMTTPHSHRSSKRRRSGPCSSGRRRESNDPIRIMFTGINPSRRHKQMINDIGAQLVDSVEDALTATHVIASDGKTKLRRTPKLMICMCKTSQILSIEWLEQSSREQRILETAEFHLLHDREAEKRYNFSMIETLENGMRARSERGGLLGGWYVYVCTGVAGNNAPSAKELNLVVEGTGAILLKSLSESEVCDPLKTIVLTSDPCTDKQRSDRGVKRVTSLGAKLLSTSWLFHAIITQDISQTDGNGGEETQQQHSGKRGSKRRATKSPPASSHDRRKSSRRR